MKKLIHFAAILMACVQCMQADTNASTAIPEDKALERKLIGKRISFVNEPKGNFIRFLDGGVLKEGNGHGSNRSGKWKIQGQQICLDDSLGAQCVDVVKITDHELVMRTQDNDPDIWDAVFVDKKGVPLRDVVKYDGKLARTLHGRVITVEEVNPPASLSGSKTIFDFNSKRTVALSVVTEEGRPALLGAADVDLPYKSSGDTLCLSISEGRERCTLTKISGNEVRMVPIKNGKLIEDKAMVGTIK
ncbi:hypothetical protein SAMN04488118_101405 [Epibacterium ulvae]|uniref:Uncharacterized protein n=2 Tax=Epibacterium ulvae TaxID=1156985 RepID=A0A1G5PPE7_9RHOB|nr:hypothetical protein SAMN04488118_101405 [Epibacterium ulvae]